jgi:hypothetical protein
MSQNHIHSFESLSTNSDATQLLKRESTKEIGAQLYFQSQP